MTDIIKVILFTENHEDPPPRYKRRENKGKDR